MKFKDQKCCIVYYSRKGMNYYGNKIIDLKIGNTARFAHMIQALTQAELFEIEPVVNYPFNYRECTEVSKLEFQQNKRPALQHHLKQAESYDVFFIGYPNWWNTLPMCVFSFLEEVQLDNKIIIPFCTHEGSGFGNSLKDLRKICPKSIFYEALDLYGSEVIDSETKIKDWIESLEDQH